MGRTHGRICRCNDRHAVSHITAIELLLLSCQIERLIDLLLGSKLDAEILAGQSRSFSGSQVVAMPYSSA